MAPDSCGSMMHHLLPKHASKQIEHMRTEAMECGTHGRVQGESRPCRSGELDNLKNVVSTPGSGGLGIFELTPTGWGS